jgi:FkbM family methyltransferase
MSFVSFAQNFEDVMLWRALKHVENGHYIDLGAAHPELDSVSKALYERGWRGVHVEPVAEYAALLRQQRKDEIVLEAAVAESSGTRTLHVSPDTGLSTFSSRYAERHAAGHNFKFERRTVRTVTLTQVFELAPFKETHWLKIDVEGAEAAAIAGWDAERYRPWLVLVEATEPLSQADASLGWRDLMTGRRYEPVYFDGLNLWFVRHESRELTRAFSSPPNIFDAFVTAKEDRLRGQVDQLSKQLDQMGRRLRDAEKQVAVHGRRPSALMADADSREATGRASALKLKAQQLGGSGDAAAAEPILRQVLDSNPKDAEALAMLAIIDSDRGRHDEAVRNGLRAAQLSDWKVPPISANLAAFIRRISHHWERARLTRRKYGQPDYTESCPEPDDGAAGDFDVVLVFRHSTTGTSEFERAFVGHSARRATIHRLPADGAARERVQHLLEQSGSDLIVFVDADAVPLEGFDRLPALLESMPDAQWAYAQAALRVPGGPSAESGYRNYRHQLESLSELPHADFGLFGRLDITAGVVCLRRAALEEVAELLPDVPLSVRAISVCAALQFKSARLSRDVVARPAAAFQEDVAAALPLLVHAYGRLLANAAQNPNAPMPREWGVTPWALAIDNGVAAHIDACRWDDLVDEVDLLTRRFAPGHFRSGGVNMIGLPFGMSGLAENMRAFVSAAAVARVRTSIGEIAPHFRPGHSDLRLIDRIGDRFPYRTSVVFSNPDVLDRNWPEQLRQPGRYTIGYWFWEFDRLPAEWGYAFDLVDEIWVATEFVRGAVAASTSKPVLVMGYPLDLEVRKPLPKSAFGLDEDTFWFLVTFDFNSWAERKNPFAAVRAFRAAFGERRDRVGLLVKSINGANRPHTLSALHELIGDDRRIVLRDESMPRDDVVALLNAADCYVSLHRSEGLGLGLAECMYLGKPVVATRYSGNLDFMTDENSCLVDYSLVSVRPNEYLHASTNEFQWAEPNVDCAAGLMRRVYQEREFRQGIGARASADIRDAFSPQRVGQRMRERLIQVGAL